MGTGEDPHSTAHGVCFLELLRLCESFNTLFILDITLFMSSLAYKASAYLSLLWGVVAALLAASVLLSVQGVTAA